MATDPPKPASPGDASSGEVYFGDPTRSMELLWQGQRGDASAVNELFGRYMPRMRRVVRIKVSGSLRTRLDPEDVLRLFFRSRTLARLLLRRAVRLGERMLPAFPDGPRRELEAVARAGFGRDRVVAANGLLHWRVLEGETIDWSYIRDRSGPFRIREVYRGPDGSLRYAVLPESET